MSIKKFFVQADTSIYNALTPSFNARGTEANTGAADSLEVFFIYGQDVRANAVLSDKLEEARILINPNLQAIFSHYGNAPSDTKFVLRLFNAEHPFTVPREFTLNVYAITEEWLEGAGVDSDNYTDAGAASWSYRTEEEQWANPGVLAGAEVPIASATFVTGTEDMEIDITTWLTANWNAPANTTFLITLPPSITNGANNEENYYTKKFFSRSSEYFFKRPVIEARSEDAIYDNRGNFKAENKALSAGQNTQKIFLYNSIEGERTNFTPPAQDEELYVRIYTDADRTTLADIDGVNDWLEGEEHSTGIYFTEVILKDNSVSKIYDEWYYSAEGDSAVEDRTVVYRSEIRVSQHLASSNTGHNDYFVSEANLKSTYSATEYAKFRFYTRLKDWSPTIYTVASKNIEANIVDKTYYKIIRLVDDEVIVDYGLGSDGLNKEHTRLSYDELGSYFDFDISMLEPGYMYGIKLMFSLNGEKLEQPETFKFRVD